MLESKWKGVPTALIVLACGAAICTYIIADNVALKLSQKGEVARLDALRVSNPQAYLKEIEDRDLAKWEVEFRALDKEGYEKFQTERNAKRKIEDRNKIEQYLARLKATPEPNLEEQKNIYSHLMALDMENVEYEKKFKSVMQQFERKRDEQERPITFVSLKSIAWNSYDFRGLLRIDVVIKNDLPWPVKDITVTCTMIAPSGTSIGQTSRTLYEKIGTKSEKSISGINMGFVNPQGKLNDCNVTNLAVLR